MRYVIGCEAVAELTVNKSTFLGYVLNVENEREARQKIELIKKKHFDARHNCFAYVIDENTVRASDDGEPQGTAGMPILEVIKSNELNHVLIVVTRYFGGVLLGTGGLTRAYSKCAALAINKAGKKEIVSASILGISCKYPQWVKIEAYLNKNSVTIGEIKYLDNVNALIYITEDKENILKHILEITAGEAELKERGETDIIK